MSPLRNCFSEAPAQKVLSPLPVSSSTRSEGSASTASRQSRNRPISAAPSALCCVGLFSVMRAMWPSRENRIGSSDMAAFMAGEAGMVAYNRAPESPAAGYQPQIQGTQ